jgi:GGDEF domain-containing protein/CHASE3 domain sensor protein
MGNLTRKDQSAADDRHADLNEAKAVDRMMGFIIGYFLRLNIARKLMLGYSSLLALLVIISVYALMNLNRLNALNTSILQTDLPVINASEKMVDAIFAQERYARRYLILGTPDVMDLFSAKKKEFEGLLEQVRSTPGGKHLPVDEIAGLHREYVDILLARSSPAEISGGLLPKSLEERIKTRQEKIIAVINKMSSDALVAQNVKTSKTATIGRIAFKASAVLCGLGFLLSLAAAMIITRNISGAIKKLTFATGLISQGQFDHKPDIRNKDELGDLAKAFVTMAGRLKRLEEMYLDTSPLTRLPGGIAIESVMNKRIADNVPIAFCLMDIDNFKALNDHYGYAKGNEIIRTTAAIIGKAVADHGNDDDFTGHIGGDDYVVITSPDRYGKICEAIISNFDETIPGFYDGADRKRGYILGENRQGDKVKFPLASISIAVVTNEKRELLNHIQFGEVAAEMKEHAKSVAGSVYMVDQRRGNKGRRSNRKLIQLQTHKKTNKGT